MGAVNITAWQADRALWRETNRAAGSLRDRGERTRWLPAIAAGEVWASFSITEPGAGSDLRRIETWVELSDGA